MKSAVIWPEPKAPVSRMKTDPVSRYQQYQEQWNKTKVPEEKKHKMLRWTVREQMLYKDIIYEVSFMYYIHSLFIIDSLLSNILFWPSNKNEVNYYTIK